MGILIDVRLRARKTDTEKVAGRELVSIVPMVRAELKNTSRVGFSTGTYDISVEDKYDEDMKSFISEYPALQNIKIEKNILSQWTRPENINAK